MGITEFYTQEQANKLLEKNNKPHIKAKSQINKKTELIEFYCTKHDYTWKQTFSNVLTKQYACYYCGLEGQAKAYLSHYNLFDIRPDVARLLENPNDAIGCAEFSNSKKYFICPICHTKLYKLVSDVSMHGLRCNACADGFSYPNKIMYNLLTKLNIDFESEYSPKWLNGKRFDFKFSVKNQIYIVEMDGLLGHGNKEISNKLDISSKEIDDLKDKLAIDHNYIVIRINAYKSDIQYLSDNINNSILSTLFNLSNINWREIDILAQKNLFLIICNYYKEHPYCSQKEMMTIFHISRNTLWKYLRKGYKYGLCPKYVISSEKYVLCEESEIIFSSYSECGRFYNIDSSSIRKCCNGLLEHFRGLHFIHLADYKGNINDLKPNYDIKANDGRKTRNVIHYNRNNNCIGIFKNAKTFCKETKYCEKTVYKVLHNDNILPDGTFLYYIDSDPNQPDKSKIIA